MMSPSVFGASLRTADGSVGILPSRLVLIQTDHDFFWAFSMATQRVFGLPSRMPRRNRDPSGSGPGGKAISPRFHLLSASLRQIQKVTSSISNAGSLRK